MESYALNVDQWGFEMNFQPGDVETGFNSAVVTIRHDNQDIAVASTTWFECSNIPQFPFGGGGIGIEACEVE